MMAGDRFQDQGPQSPLKKTPIKKNHLKATGISWIKGLKDLPLSLIPRRTKKPVPKTTDHEQVIELTGQVELFKNLKIQDVMTPRADIIALDISTSLEDVAREFARSEWTRLPVFRESLDDPLGFVHIKDIVKRLVPLKKTPALPQTQAGRSPSKEASLHRLRRDILYVPPSMPCADLLLKMRVARIHMALVIDEFGGVDGLVTLADLLEAVVGDIDDEHDDQIVPEIFSCGDDVFEVDARLALEDLENALGQALNSEEEADVVETSGGFITAFAGRLPQRGEVILHPSGYEFEIMEADPRRIRRFRVRPSPIAEAANLEKGATDPPKD